MIAQFAIIFTLGLLGMVCATVANRAISDKRTD